MLINNYVSPETISTETKCTDDELKHYGCVIDYCQPSL